METIEQEKKVIEDDEVWTPAQLGKFLGYKPETIRSYSTQHPDRLPPRIAGLKRPRWLRSVAMEWARGSGNTERIEAPVTPSLPPRAPRKPQVGRPRKVPAH